MRTFNGKPMSHWNKMATEIVVEVMLRGAHLGCNPEALSLPQQIASKRLLELARAESQEAFDKVVAEHDRCLRGFGVVMRDVLAK